MSVRVGKPAPDLMVDAYVRGEPGPRPVRLADHRGKWLVLFFYPRDFTFVCPTEIQAFARLHDEFRREGAAVLGASTNSYFSHKAWFEADPRLRGVAYPVLADTSHALGEAFGVLLEDGTALRATFIVDPDGVVRHIQVNDLDIGRNVEETLRLLRALRTGELCPAAWRPGQPTLSGGQEATVITPAQVAEQGLVAELTDETLPAFLEGERAALILARSDCGHCARYQAEVEALLARGGLSDVAVGKLVLDRPGGARFKRDNP